MFFLKIGIVDFGLYFGTIDTEVHKKSIIVPKEPKELTISPFSCHSFLNAIFIKITPHGKEFAMLLPRPHGVGNVVARGYHLRGATRKPESCFVQSPR